MKRASGILRMRFGFNRETMLAKSLIDSGIVEEHDGRAFKQRSSKYEKIYPNHLHRQSGVRWPDLLRMRNATRPPRQYRLIQVICSLIVSQILGADLSLVVSVDGKDVGSFTEGRNYSGYLSAGQHTIIARCDPNPGGKRPARKTITVQAGHTYSYTAAWSGTNLVLVMNQGQTVLPQSAY